MRLTMELPEPLSINRLLRLHHRDRSRMRDELIYRVLAQRPRGWKSLPKVRLHATLRLWQLRDPLELAACLKIHVDAMHRAGLFHDDGPQYLEVGEIRQVVDRGNRGVTVTVEAA